MPPHWIAAGVLLLSMLGGCGQPADDPDRPTWGVTLPSGIPGPPRFMEAPDDVGRLTSFLEGELGAVMEACGGREPPRETLDLWRERYGTAPLVLLHESFYLCEVEARRAAQEGRKSPSQGTLEAQVDAFRDVRQKLMDRLRPASLADIQLLARLMEEYYSWTGNALYPNSVSGEPLNETQRDYLPDPAMLGALLLVGEVVDRYPWAEASCTFTASATQARTDWEALAERARNLDPGEESRNLLTVYGEIERRMPGRIAFSEQWGWWPYLMTIETQVRWSQEYFDALESGRPLPRQSEALLLAEHHQAQGVYITEQYFVVRQANGARQMDDWEEDYVDFARTFSALDGLRWPVEWLDCQASG